MLSGDTLLMMIFMSMATRDAKHAKARDFICKVGLSDVQSTPQNTMEKDYLILVVIECKYLFCTLQKLLMYKKKY